MEKVVDSRGNSLKIGDTVRCSAFDCNCGISGTITNFEMRDEGPAVYINGVTESGNIIDAESGPFRAKEVALMPEKVSLTDSEFTVNLNALLKEI